MANKNKKSKKDIPIHIKTTFDKFIEIAVSGNPKPKKKKRLK